MRHMRRAYYNKFSRLYDRFVALQSRDKQGLARSFLADRMPAEDGSSVLDVCTGTGSLLSHLQTKVGPGGHVVAVDFSRGMLKVAREKTRNLLNVHLVQADASRLPFSAGTFDGVTCSHAFYELKGETQRWTLQEIVRVLKPQGTFLMMEHDVPRNAFVRALFYLRLASMGAVRAITFLRHEREVLERYFGSVKKVEPPGGRSKVVICRK
jgi:ubiquinone/menaquinone biosynthesis C-methylase UbiE